MGLGENGDKPDWRDGLLDEVNAYHLGAETFRAFVASKMAVELLEEVIADREDGLPAGLRLFEQQRGASWVAQCDHCAKRQSFKDGYAAVSAVGFAHFPDCVIMRIHRFLGDEV